MAAAQAQAPDAREMTRPRYWTRASRELAARDDILARLVEAHGALPLRSRGDAFSTLARAIVGQQISVKAAQSVWARLLAEVQTIAPQSLLAADPVRVRACGLSGQKLAYLLDLAARFDRGTLDPSAWDVLEDEALIAELVQVKGIGRWTAEIFLIFYLARPDVFPVADVGLQRAMSVQYNKGRPLTKARMEKIGKAWAPWRSVATWYMWRSLDAAPVQR
jgi:DNA-3-methyladenine glycosylase II